jgi:hypothetical protein
MTDDEKRQQVADQCKVVAHLAKAIHEVYSDKARMFEANATDLFDLIEMNGKRSAALMETFGNILNGMDAVEDDDAWVDPIFRKAQELWPQ